MAPRRVPADLPAKAAALQSVSALARSYSRTRQTIREWLDASGIDRSQWRTRHMADKRPRIGAAELLRAKSRDEAKRLFGIGSDTASALAREHGVAWARRGRVQRVLPRHGAAARFLRTMERVLDFGETYGHMHDGRRYVIGRRRFTPEELIHRALMMGWRP